MRQEIEQRRAELEQTAEFHRRSLSTGQLVHVLIRKTAHPEPQPYALYLLFDPLSFLKSK